MAGFLPTDTLDTADSLDFQDDLQNGLSSVQFAGALAPALKGIRSTLDAWKQSGPRPLSTDNLPIVVSPEPGSQPIQTADELQATYQSGQTGQPVQDTPASSAAGATPPSATDPSASAPAGASPTPAGAPSAMPTNDGSGLSDEAWARQEAARLGIDPDTAVKVGNTEGGFNIPGRQNSDGAPAYSSYQDYIGGPSNPGLGDEMLAQGIDPRDPAQSKRAITYNLEHAKKNGWSAFQGAAAHGIGNWDGIGQAPAPSSAATAQPSTRTSAPNQDVDQAALDDPDKWVLCGPVAAVIAAGRRGANWTVAQAKQISQAANLWDARQGMHGLQSEVDLLNKMNIPAKTGSADAQTLISEAQSGNTPIVSTPNHYFVLTGYDPATGTFDTTTTGGVYKAGARRMTLDQIERVGGGIQGAAYMDNPSSPTPSVATQQGDDQWSDQTKPSMPSAPSTSQPMASNQTSTTALSSTPLSATSNTPISPSADQMLRQPLNQPMFSADQYPSFTDSQTEPASSDSVVTASTSSTPLPSSSTSLPTDASSSGVDASAAPAQPTPGAGAFQDDQTDAGSHTLDAPDTSGPVVGPTQPGASIVRRIQDAGGAAKAGLTPILDAAGKVLAWVHDEGRSPDAQPAAADANSYAMEQSGQTGMEPQQAQIANTVATEGIATPIARAIQTPINAALGRPAPVDTGQPETPIDRALVQTGQSIANDVGQLRSGYESGSVAQAGLGALGLAGDLAPTTTLARQLSEMFPKADVPLLGEVGVGDVVMGAQLLHDAIRLGYAVPGAVRAAPRVWSKIADAVKAGVPAEKFAEWAQGIGQRIGSALDENAGRVAALDAERAGEGSLSAPGVFGVAPPEAGSAAADVARPRFVPPEVRAQLTPNVEIPDDPRLQAAVQAVGGKITPDGIEVHVTRAQGADAAGGVATRGGVFVEAVPEGGQSNYARSADNPNAVGGSTVIPPTKTTYRKPLVIDDAPGAGRGFDQAMERLGQTTAPEVAGAKQALQSAQEAENALLRERAATQSRWGEGPVPWEESMTGRKITSSLQQATEARTAAETRLDELMPTSAGIDRAIKAARVAGPEGSPQRAQALKDLVSKYGGDPSVIDDLIKIRGVDASESQWAIKENIVAANARKAGYDGVFTVKDGRLPPSAVANHPDVVQARAKYETAYHAYEDAKQANLEATQRAWELENETPAGGQKSPEYYAASEARFVTGNKLDKASTAATQAEQALREVEDRLAVRPKITEIFDVQQGKNPTPGALSPSAKAAEDAYGTAQKAYLDARFNPGNYTKPQVDALMAERDARYAAMQASKNDFTGAPGYSLHPDLVRPTAEPASTTAAGTAGIVPIPMRSAGDVGASVAASKGFFDKATPILSQGVASAVSGGVGAAYEQQAGDPNDPNRALKGFATFAAAPYLLSKGAGALARRAGREIPQAEGALGVFGSAPKAGTPAASANPHIRDMARQMAGDYKPVGAQRPLGERLVAALTDRWAIHANAPNEANARIAKAGGTPVANRLFDRMQLNAGSAGAQRAREEIAPALQKLGNDDEWGAQYLVYRHNLDIAKAKAQDAYDAAIAAGRSPQQAQLVQQRVQSSRMFSGGMTESDITQALTDMAKELGPQRFQNVTDAAQDFWKAGAANLKAKEAEGILTPADVQYLQTKYPHYVRTDIADYADKGPSNPSPGGKSLGISSTGIQPISMTGTSKDRINPIMSTIDSIYSTESAVVRNQAAKDLVSVRDADPTTAGLFKEVAPDIKTWRANQQTMVPPDYTLRNGEQKLTAFGTVAPGDARQFVVPKEYSALMTPAPGSLLGDTAAPFRTFMNVLKQVQTAINPVFQMVTSPIRDAPDAMVGMQTAAGAAARRPGASLPENIVREAGASVGAFPEAIGRIAQGYKQAFEGMLSNQYGPRAAELMKAGAGFDSRPGLEYAGRLPRWLVGPHDTRSVMDDLKKGGGVEVHSVPDALRTFKSFMTAGAERVGGRMEMAPRLAAANFDKARGGDLVSQVGAYQNSTINFLRGGWLTQQASVPIMFLNPTVQAAAQTRRLYRQSPAAYIAALMTTVAIPTMLSEAWNRSDPERAASYDDRSDYLKNTGIIWEAPGLPQGTGKLGEALPNFAYVPVGNHAYAVRIAREALGLLDPVTGLTPASGNQDDLSDPMHWVKFGASIINSFSPLKGGDATAVAGGMVPPGMRDVIELGQNKNLYTGSTVATDRTDESASNLSKGIASGANSLLGTEWRPSQVEHELTGTLGYPGRAAAAASDVVAGRQRPDTHPIQDIPGAGGVVRGLIRDTGGQQLQNAQDQQDTPDLLNTLHEAGMRSDQAPPVPSRYQGAPLTKAEQLTWQIEYNGQQSRAISAAYHDPRWRNPATQQQALQDALSKARQDAATRALRHLTPKVIQDRIRDEQDQKAS